MTDAADASKIVIIAAVARNRVIGHNGDLPWTMPKDLARFKAVTMGVPMIMGRKTFESIGSRPLPGRRAIVVSRGNNHDYPKNVSVERTIEKAIANAQRDQPPRIMIAGGAVIYRLALPYTDVIDLTVIDAEPEGDTFFPEVDWSGWQLVNEEAHPADANHAHPFAFRTYERVTAASPPSES